MSDEGILNKNCVNDTMAASDEASLLETGEGNYDTASNNEAMLKEKIMMDPAIANHIYSYLWGKPYSHNYGDRVHCLACMELWPHIPDELPVRSVQWVNFHIVNTHKILQSISRDIVVNGETGEIDSSNTHLVYTDFQLQRFIVMGDMARNDLFLGGQANSHGSNDPDQYYEEWGYNSD